MEFGKHIGKGIWGLADKGLPVVYGMAYVVLVIRVLPEGEFGNFVLIQELFLVISGLAAAFALSPLLKFAAEEGSDHANVIGAALFLNLAFILFASIFILVIRIPFGAVLNSPQLPALMLYIPAMLAASFLRNFALILLQTRFMVREIFLVDAVHFLGVPVLIWVFSRMNLFDSARDLIIFNIVTLSASSLVGLCLSRSLFHLSLTPHSKEIRRLWEYGKYSLGSIASYMVYSKADTFILSAFRGPVQVAVYNSVKVFIRIDDMANQVIQMFVLPGSSRYASKGEFASLSALVEKTIVFTTVMLFPVFLAFLFFAPFLVTVVYGGRYQEAIPLLQMFSMLSLVVPLSSVASSTLMGLGHAKIGFVVSIQILVLSPITYFVFINLLGTTGAAIGFVIASLFLAWLSTRQVNRFVPIKARALLSRINDIKSFLRSRLNR